MKIILDHIMPFPLASIQHGSESIWGNYIELVPGKHILLNASSGKGKSTFTMTTIGLRRDYEGKLTYDGRNILTFSPDEWTKIRQEKVSVVYQDLQLFPNLTVAENLILKNKLTHVYTETELKEMLERLEIDNKWEQKCGLLSMGQQQRLAIVRAMCQPFEWLIMDEPYSHLDELNAKKCMQLIDKRCGEQNAGFVLTTLGDSHGYQYDQELKL
ncbi:MAG: ATP-binding cassette domain-containing protein [Flavobacteriia bacterium]|nr:ATP-binding cassette domain-containing protein [Flavobacteriia bacterium]